MRGPIHLAPALYAAAVGMIFAVTAAAEQRNAVSYLRGPYNFAFYERHPGDYKLTTIAHWAHGAVHDEIMRVGYDPADVRGADENLFAQALYYFDHPPRVEPHQEYVGPQFARLAWRIPNVINWTHQLHEQLYDIMADDSIALPDKQKWLGRSVAYYLSEPGIALSPAPFEEVVMKRVQLMKQPWFRSFRQKWPLANSLFWGFHWWHPVVYEAQLVYHEEQDRAVKNIDRLFTETVLRHPPNRMVLSREAMPRFSKLAPAAANIFDNLHMLHGIIYDILAYPELTMQQKRRELYRVLDLMLARPGDMSLAADFPIPYPDYDPTTYDLQIWTRDAGEMGRIMGMTMPAQLEHHPPAHAAMQMPEDRIADLMARYERGEVKIRGIRY